MRNRLLACLACLATLMLVSCGAPSTPDFVSDVAMSNLYEIEAGQLASEKGQSEAVKAFGRRMVEAHGKASEDLKAIVQTENLKVELPAKLGKRQQGMIDKLNRVKPEDFDKAYAQQQVRVHKRVAELFDDYAEAGDNPALKEFAANALLTIKQHREQAKKLLQ